MKWKGIRLLCITASFFAILYACNKSDPGGTGSGHQVEFVRTTISGRITDENNLPVTGANVTAGATSITTDANGYFNLKNIYVDKNAALVKVEKAGYFLGTKTVMIEIEKNNPVNMQLMPKTIAGTIDAASGGEVTVPAAGGSIQLPANGVIDPQSNKPYTGAVTVSAAFIDPSADNFRQIMPGTLRGINTNNEETGLQSFGMMAVELNGAGGEKLQIASGKKATLHFPIPSALRSQAPATIPLWSLDEKTGLWKEEGQATKQDNQYVGEVSHFSFWNCDAPFPIANFTVTLKDQNAQAIPDVEVVISASLTDTTSIAGNGYTNAEGVVKGTLPASRALKLKVYDKCRNMIHSQNIGPYTTDTDLGTIIVNTQMSSLTISGTVTDCNNIPVANGYVMLQLENVYYSVPVTNGNFAKAIIRCNNNATTANIKAYDLANNVSGSTISVPVSGTTLKAGQLYACGTALTSYIKYSVDGVNYQTASPADSMVAIITRSNAIIGSFSKIDSTITHIIFMISGGAGAANTMNTLYVSNGLSGGNQVMYHSGSNLSVPVAVSEYGTAIGEYVSGAFSSSVYDSTRNVSMPVQCNFRVKVTRVE
ncbi:MAG: carboxypeptidase regulatory-like domain-containing protein [Niastella sp.]|nr:carboxypeptidase regulatory-like domain-containing protein [Niastella sp.]